MNCARAVLRLLLAAIAMTAVLCAAATAYFTFVPDAEDYGHRRSFDSALWRAKPADGDPEWPLRLRMVDDLVSSKALDGCTRREVESLLGPDDETDKWEEWDLVYWLGPERRGLFRVDSEWLVLRFGSDGRAAEYRIVGD